MIHINRRQILISGVFLWLFAVGGTTLVALTEYSTSAAIAENERQLLLRNLYALLPRDSLDNDIAADTVELSAAPLLGTDVVSTAYRARLAGEPVAVFTTKDPKPGIDSFPRISNEVGKSTSGCDP